MSETGQTGGRRVVSFGEAFRFWVKLGWISFGGPAGQIAIMHRELVERRRWLSEERFLHALNYCMMLPGPEAQQLAIYIGWLMHRTWGGIVAGAFFVIPSIFILMVLSYIYAAYGNTEMVAGLLAGFKPVVVAIVVEAVWKIGGRALKRRAHVAIAAAAFASIFFLRVPFPVIVLVAALIGLFGVRLWPAAFAAAQTKPGGGQEGKSEADEKRRAGDTTGELPLVIDDDAPPPPHTRPARGRVLRILLTGLVLWAVPLFALIWWRGAGSLHAGEYLFFTKAALVTFGGAYAVLAYVTQAVTHAPFDWLTPTQAVDGLALAETTPGPLIMVLQFVGFMAGWNNAPEGLSPAVSGVLGALVTTYVTFLPSFLFILVGAPYIEVVRGNRHLAGALTGVTASVVGVILNLALVFGAAVLFPRGLAGGVEWMAAVLSCAAFIALSRFKADVLWVVLVGGLVGLVYEILK
ncbi:MAG TPA: chromate transporter [Pyrinomonadaceae bacterium]|nr:chromate transporter [Pyrinomonadaceae bacterium]